MEPNGNDVAPAKPKLRKREHVGDILDAPTNAMLIHAVNCVGVWGSGIAFHLKKHVKSSYEVYQTFLIDKQTPQKPGNFSTRSVLGECLIIDPANCRLLDTGRMQDNANKFFWMACLFTSLGYGTRPSTYNPGRSPKEEILQATATAVDHMLRQLTDLYDAMLHWPENAQHLYFPPLELWTCQFNSGMFNVPWEESEAILVKALEQWEHANKVELVVVKPVDVGARNPLNARK